MPMKQRELKKMDTRIKAIRKAAEELKTFSAEIPAVNRNADRILASTKMLEINVSDVLELEG
jgi:pyruvate formate-lyase activating enzyme-like uncharacterized protein